MMTLLPLCAKAQKTSITYKFVHSYSFKLFVIFNILSANLRWNKYTANAKACLTHILVREDEMLEFGFFFPSIISTCTTFMHLYDFICDSYQDN